MKLTVGTKYNISTLTCTGWTEGDGSGHDGYNVSDYFPGGIYAGADEHGIEPLFTQAVTHTPGPWTIEGVEWINTPDAGGYRCLQVNAENFTVANVMADEDDGEQAANARLIASAPDLLAALKDVLSEAIFLLRLAPGGEAGESDAMQRARGAIAKATA